MSTHVSYMADGKKHMLGVDFDILPRTGERIVYVGDTTDFIYEVQSVTHCIQRVKNQEKRVQTIIDFGACIERHPHSGHRVHPAIQENTK